MIPYKTSIFLNRAKMGHNGIRMGFAAYNEDEIHTVLKKLKLAFAESYPKLIEQQ